VISTEKRKQFKQQQRAYHAAKLVESYAELAAIDAAERNVVEVGESRSSKRRRS